MHEPVRITLDFPTIYQVACLGLWRRVDSLQRGLRDKFSSPPQGGYWLFDEEGALREAVVQIYLGLPIKIEVGTYKGADILPDIQVRGNSFLDSTMPMKENDKDDHRYIHVVGEAPHFEIRGWIWGSEGKANPLWLTERSGIYTYRVPQEALRSMDTFDKSLVQGAHTCQSPAIAPELVVSI